MLFAKIAKHRDATSDLALELRSIHRTLEGFRDKQPEAPRTYQSLEQTILPVLLKWKYDIKRSLGEDVNPRTVYFLELFYKYIDKDDAGSSLSRFLTGEFQRESSICHNS